MRETREQKRQWHEHLERMEYLRNKEDRTKEEDDELFSGMVTAHSHKPEIPKEIKTMETIIGIMAFISSICVPLFFGSVFSHFNMNNTLS